MLNRLEEIKLLALCATVDNREAFGRLVEEYQEPLRRFLYSLTMGNAYLTDDLAQETFLKAYKSIRSFERISKFKTWLYRIAYNEYINWLRQNNIYGDEKDIRDKLVDYDIHHNVETRHDIEVGLSVLNPTERTLILLFYLEDKSIKDIKRITKLPEGTIKVYLSRAKTKMFNAIKNN